MIIKLIMEQSERSGIVRTQRGASTSEVHHAESRLGVTFPLVYNSLLRRFGVVRVYDRWIAGLGPYATPLGSTHADVIRQTEMGRLMIGLPNHLVAICENQHYDFTCLDTSRIHDGDCPIMYLDMDMVDEGNHTPKEIAPSLAAWIPLFVEKQMAKKKMLEREMPGVHTHMGDIRSAKAIRAWKKKRKRK